MSVLSSLALHKAHQKTRMAMKRRVLEVQRLLLTMKRMTTASSSRTRKQVLLKKSMISLHNMTLRKPVMAST
jgi:hypothetical protein